MGINKVILVGNVGRDVDFRTLASGTALAKFTLATSDARSKDEDGKPRTEWHNVVAWSRLAEICDQYVKKGMQLYLEGQIRTRNYEKDGQTKYFTEIHIFSMEMLGRKGEGGGGQDDAPPWGESSPSENSGGLPSDADDIPF
jgi:single-strand DNA-binding protein